jgi:hypothetical protein
MSQQAERGHPETPHNSQPGFLRWKFSRPGRIISSLAAIAVITAALTAIDFLGGLRPDMVLNIGTAVLVSLVIDGFTYHWEMTGKKKSRTVKFATGIAAGVVTTLVLATALSALGM